MLLAMSVSGVRLRAAVGAVLLFTSSMAPAQLTWSPTHAVELIVFAAPGGGNDKAARYLNRIWQENKMLEAVVTNKVGGGGSLAYTYVSQKAGDAHYIAIAQAGLLTNHITRRCSPKSE